MGSESTSARLNRLRAEAGNVLRTLRRLPPSAPPTAEAPAQSARLARLRADTDAALRSLPRAAPAAGSTPETPSARMRGWPPTSAAMFPTARPATSGIAGDSTVNVNLMGGTVFLDDERTIRALAKEIKRLLAEDRRRGLGVGG